MLIECSIPSIYTIYVLLQELHAYSSCRGHSHIALDYHVRNSCYNRNHNSEIVMLSSTLSLI